MYVAHHDHGFYCVPAGQLAWVEIDGNLVGVHDQPAYLNTDGSLEPGSLRSPIKTDIVYTHFPENGADYESNRRMRPVVCHVCHDSGEDGRGWTNYCAGCHGHGHRKSQHLCAECGEFSDEILPVHPRAELTHELLLPHAHVSCAIESLRDAGEVVRASAAA